MSRTVCTRVACLRIPWFPIDVLRRSGRAGTASPLALVAGRGTHAQLAAVDPAARAAGVKVGMRPSQARALLASLELAPWDEELDEAILVASGGLTQRLETLTPRQSLVAPGVLWLEPASRSPVAGRAEPTEVAFADAVLEAVEGEGFPGARVGIADGPVAAEAATRVGGLPVRRVPVGEDRVFLAGLPLRALRLSARVHGLLDTLGVRRVGTLQGMKVHELEARFGPEGRWAWRVACGEDPRRPVTPRPSPEQRAEVVLDGATERVEPLLFALRPAVAQVVDQLARRGRAVVRASVELRRAWGLDVAVPVAPSRPASQSELVFELLRRRLSEPGLLDPSGGPIVSATFEVGQSAPLAPLQGDLFSAWVDPAAAEAALVRLAGRLGEAAVARGVAVDERRPERRGAWAAVVEQGRAHAPTDGPARTPPVPDELGRVRACLRLLDRPAAAEPHRDGRLLVRGAGLSEVSVRTWHGPERLSGHWWEDAYDRDYYWALAADGRVFWVYRDRCAGGWFLHGWLD